MRAEIPKVIRQMPGTSDNTAVVRKSLAHGEEKWGDTWLHRPREGQEQRIKQYFDDQFDQHLYAGTPIRWEAIAGEALIGWIRDNYPGLFEGNDD